ncbi:MAG: hypothetical protein JW797_00540 [Bradymonadales bacterium]|nr:hypothetical protein [Bradymonadales bacterium]
MSARISAGGLLLACFILSAVGCEALFGDPAEPVSPERSVGEACETREECRTGLTCQDGTCQPAGDRQEGSSCILTGECVEGLYCSPNGFCQPAGDSQLNEACTTNADCVAGLFCDYRGFIGVCQEPGAADFGQECTTTADCMAGLGCGPSGSCIQGLQAGGLVVFSGGTCPDTELADEAPFEVIFHVPRSGETITDFYSLPFPNDIRRRTGRVDLSGHPRPELDVVGNVVKTLISQIEQDVTGFGLNQTIFFRFNTLPDRATITLGGEDAVLQIVNIDPDSDHYTQQKSVAWSATDARGLFICHNWMGVRSYWDEPFDPDTTYAVLFTDGIRGIGNRMPAQAEDLAALLSDTEPTDPDLREAWLTYEPLRSYLADREIDPDTIVGATVFTTGNPSRHQSGIYQAVQQLDQIEHTSPVLCSTTTTSPCDDGLTGAEHQRGCSAPSDDYWEIHLQVEVPVFQEGTPPYLEEGGSILFDEGGVAILQGTHPVCTVLTIPKEGTMPESGWPVVVFAHGTGGSFTSHLSTLAADLSELGFVTLGFDGVQHGSRRGDSALSPEVLFFNYANPRAAAGNVMQGSADVHFFGRFAAQLQLDDEDSPLSDPILLDPERLVFFGHSQGGTVGVPALAHDDVYVAAILSGTGGGLMLSLPEKHSPIDIAAGLEIILSGETLSDFHPVMNLVQMYFEPADPLSYGSQLIYNRPEEMAGFHLFQGWGLGDTYTPERTTKELALAIGLPLMTPVLVNYPRPPVDPPVSGNLLVGGERYTCALGQYNPPEGQDGHFVLFDNPTARSQVLGFLETLLTDPVPTIPAP